MDLLIKYFPHLTEKQISQFHQLEPLYRCWNDKINVISRKDIDSLYERHILHSLAIGFEFRFNNGTTILDVGTGGGFPGIPLAILFPNVRFSLIDSIGKKISVVKNIIQELNLTNCIAYQARVENVKDKFDFIVSRAVTDFSTFAKWTSCKISRNNSNTFTNGIIYLKGGDLDEELKDFKDKIKVYHINEMYSEPFFDTKKIIYLPQSM
jgi:16S rRNA (guanine527-N7)-methyltransferase